MVSRRSRSRSGSAVRDRAMARLRAGPVARGRPRTDLGGRYPWARVRATLAL